MPGHHKKVRSERLFGPEKVSLVGTHHHRLGAYPRKKDIPHYPTSNISLVQVFLVLQSIQLLQSFLLLLLLLLIQTLQSFQLLQTRQSFLLLQVLQLLQLLQVRQARPSPLLEVPLVAAAP